MSTKTVLRAIHRGRLRASRLGEHGAFRIREADVERWIESSVLDIPLPARAMATPERPPAPPAAGRLVLTSEMGRS